MAYIGDDERIDRVDADGGGVKRLTKGPQDHLPSISPDRTQVAYLVGAAGEPRILMMLDVATGQSEEVFDGEGPCANSVRPGWSLDGAWLALLCAGDEDEPAGIYLANPVNGAAYALMTDMPPLSGSPTWVDENTIVYTQTDETLWSLDIDLGNYRAERAPSQLTITDMPDARLSHPDWSEQAGKLLFVVHPDDTEFGELWVADKNLENAESIGEGYAHPVWSPSGDAVAFTMKDDDGVEVLATAPYVNGELGPATDVKPVPDGEVGIPVWGSR